VTSPHIATYRDIAPYRHFQSGAQPRTQRIRSRRIATHRHPSQRIAVNRDVSRRIATHRPEPHTVCNLIMAAPTSNHLLELGDRLAHPLRVGIGVELRYNKSALYRYVSTSRGAARSGPDRDPSPRVATCRHIAPRIATYREKSHPYTCLRGPWPRATSAPLLLRMGPAAWDSTRRVW
jgi:hypothetical protein